MPISKTKAGYMLQINRKDVPRIRRTFPTLRAAEQFERDHLFKYLGDGGGGAEKLHQAVKNSVADQDNRSLYELLDIWWRYYGVNLSDGPRRRRVLEAMFSRLGHKNARTLLPSQFLDYRYECMFRSIKPVMAKTFNNRHVYLAAMYRTLKKLKIIAYDCPIAEVELVKIQEKQLSYLSPGQIETLFDALKACRNKSVWWIAQICIRTGARWGEAEQLKRKQLHNGRVTFEFTKSKKVRTVPLDADFYAELLDFSRCKDPEDRIFKDGMMAFNRVVAKTDLVLPRGQATHILRHSFASCFISNGGDILTLQRVLGHSDIKMTMRYAHLSPSHLNDAVKLNPLAK
jgi:integrase